MESSYGIGVENRYSLFCLDDEGNNPQEAIRIKKAKAKKAAAAAAKLSGAAEKENKVSATSATLIKPVEATKAAVNTAGPKSGAQQNGQQKPRPIKETQNVRNNERAPREGDNKQIRDNNTKSFDRSNNNNQVGQRTNGENREQREQRYNRRNRDDTQRPASQTPHTAGGNNTYHNNGTTQEYNNREDRPPRRVGGGAGFEGGRREGGGAPRRPFDGRKREFDRQSGSDKTGVKAVDKREGGGAHNWGTHKQDIEDLNKSTSVDEEVKDENNTTATDANATIKEDSAVPAENAEEEAKEITLDEWKAQQGIRAKPQFNIRKAGEGEDTTKWKKMVLLESRKKKEDENSEDELEYDPSMYPQRVGRQKMVLDIQFNFNDGRRNGGLNRGRGGAGGGGAGGRPRPSGGPGGPGGAPGRGPPRRFENTDGGEGGENRAPRGDASERGPRIERGERPERTQRAPREPRVETRSAFTEDRQRAGHGQNAPKVDNELDFPSLG